MPKYHVYGTVTGSKYLGVYEADAADQAVELALNEAAVSMCCQCSEECEDPQVTDAEAEEMTDGDG